MNLPGPPSLTRMHIAPMVALLAVTSLVHSVPADAQRPPAVNAQNVREEILGWDPGRDVIGFIERTPTVLTGFSHVAIVEVGRDGSTRRIPLTTDEDVAQWRAAQNNPSVTQAIDARVERDVAANRARYRAGDSLPVALNSSASGCTREPYATRHFNVGDGAFAEVSVTPGSGDASLVFGAGDHRSAPVTIPAVIVTSAGATTHVPYDRLADVREFPGTDIVAVLMRSDACTVGGVPVPARALIVGALPVPEQPLQALPHAELEERMVISAIAPHARRRTVDEVSSYFDGGARIVFDTAWQLPGSDKLLVQYTRIEQDVPPPVVDAGEANAMFAIMRQDERGRLRVVQQLLPPTRENVFEGIGQETYATDLDGDGRPELFVRAHYRPNGEEGTLLRWGTDDSLMFVWRVALANDDRTVSPGPAEVRHCTAGVDERVLVVRCTLDQYPAGATSGTPPTSSSRLIQRARWNGGALDLREERR